MKTVLTFLMAVPMFAATCESLASLALPDSTITMAHVVAAGQFTPPGPGQAKVKTALVYRGWAAINNGLGGVIDTRAPITALAIGPSGGVLYLGTSSGVFRSVDGGMSWTAFNYGLENLDVRTLAVTSGGSPLLYAGTPGGVFKIEDKRERVR
jgi:hypothetical protein